MVGEQSHHTIMSDRGTFQGSYERTIHTLASSMHRINIKRRRRPVLPDMSSGSMFSRPTALTKVLSLTTNVPLLPSRTCSLLIDNPESVDPENEILLQLPMPLGHQYPWAASSHFLQARSSCEAELFGADHRSHLDRQSLRSVICPGRAVQRDATQLLMRNICMPWSQVIPEEVLVVVTHQQSLIMRSMTNRQTSTPLHTR